MKDGAFNMNAPRQQTHSIVSGMKSENLNSVPASSSTRVTPQSPSSPPNGSWRVGIPDDATRGVAGVATRAMRQYKCSFSGWVELTDMALK